MNNDNTILAKVKLAKRITHNALDNDILDNILAAKDEIERAGIPHSVATDTSKPLIAQAVKTYCLSFLANDLAEAEKYQMSFQSQLDNLRKSSAYNTEVPPNGE